MILIPVGLAGLVLLYYGAEYLVRGSAALAARCRIPPLIVGLTIVAYGTSAPELFVSTGAAMKGLGDVCVGNIVGSNICNIALILGLTALIAPFKIEGMDAVDFGVMIAMAVCLWPVMKPQNRLGRLEGLLLLSFYAAYLVWLVCKM